MKCQGAKPIIINQKDLAGLQPEARPSVEEALKEINTDPCNEAQYKKGWEVFTNTAPQIGIPLLIKEVGQMKPEDPSRKTLLDVLDQHNAEFFLYVESPQSKSIPAMMLLGVLLAYAKEHTEVKVQPPLEAITERFLKNGGCFSSLKYEYPKKLKDFPAYFFSQERELGWEYLPLLEGSLKQGSCNDAEAIQIMNDLRYIGGPPGKITELLDWIFKNRRRDNPEFARAYLHLASLTPYQRSYEEATKWALLNLIPPQPKKGAHPGVSEEDAGLIEQSVHFILFKLPKPEERQAFVNEIASQRPWFQESLMGMAHLLLPRPR